MEEMAWHLTNCSTLESRSSTLLGHHSRIGPGGVGVNESPREQEHRELPQTLASYWIG